MFKISFFVPVDHAEKVKQAMFLSGAGKIGAYECCSFETLGTGQFRALEGANPFIGTINEIEKVEELKVEMVCDEKFIKAAVLAMKENHPYEVPAYDIIKTENF